MTKGLRSYHTLDKDLGRITHAEAAQRYAFRPVWWLGLGSLALVLGIFLSVGIAGTHASTIGLGAGLIVAGWLGLAIGSNDVANSLGPAVGAGAIGLLPGLIMVAIAEIGGASLAGGAVTTRLASGLFDFEGLTTGPAAPIAMLSALIATAIWITAATGIGLPVSTSHSMVGGIAGAGVTAFGLYSVDWQALGLIASVWIVAPLISATVAGALLVYLRSRIIDAKDRQEAARFYIPLVGAAMCGLFATYVAILVEQRIGGRLALPVGIGSTLLGFVVMRRFLEAELAASGGKASVKRIFRPALLVAVIMMGFAHGANDVGNIAGPLTVMLSGPALAQTGTVPLFVLAAAGAAIALGTLLFGRRLVVMVGSGITRLNAGRAFCVSLATALVVLTSSSLGLPVSTTHVAVGGIFGVGFAREWMDRRKNKRRAPLPAEETRRRLLIRRSHVATISVAWVITVPLTALLGAGLCLVFLAFSGLD
ncbi:inorganic phosphate transporter [Paracoccus sp. Z330]|uniref:Phosphate transporter n=1 Tax=Paracoccus onchidii TaxID=3017813 RepID=A0ABT4ZCL7_9RHOB|nr:inorganic phosphate transporter [Paracoccus onchidii]MDB6177114.1 inorganic phosphate transporter [Paracoccus onchidii]